MTAVDRSGRTPASVLIPLLPGEDGFRVLFEVRSPQIAQGGEICFPGGSCEDGESPEHTAVRETCEELGVTGQQIELAAPLCSMSGPKGRTVFSYLGFLRGYRGTFANEEVDHVFSIPLQELLEAEPMEGHAKLIVRPDEDFPFDLIQGGQNYRWSTQTRTYYFYPTREDGAIWGVTADLLRQFLYLIKEK